MTPERYRQIDQIFQAALGLEPEQRTAYLDEVCSGDEKLRREVESLITSDQGGLSFIDEPAFEMAARVLASDEPALAAGDLIERYEVVSQLGSGGMGEVYLAHDEKLDRRIALKLLPAYFTTNQARLRRFQQEARAASALNHPNIITIHEIGQVENRNFIATEFVDGETLRQRMKRGPLSLNESLDIAIQVCGALAAAHHAGIVHRDIKPENIMLRRDGYVKVLDFGLAKLAEQREQPTEVDAADNVDISSGLLMGTVKYMSPEQAQGQQVDQRSDIFSLGVVLYEMVTGHAPFKGKDTSHLVKSILKDEPRRLTDYASSAPEELQRIVSKPLMKNRAQRYQAAEDLLVDLKTLRQQVELSTESQSVNHRAAGRISIPRRWRLAALAAVCVFTIGLGVTIYQRRQRSGHPTRPQSMKVTKISNGGAWVPSISPDGKYVAYVANNANGELGIWIKVVATGYAYQLVAPAGVNYGMPCFSRDSSYLYYSIQDMNNMSEYFLADWYRIPIAGGASRKIISSIGGLTFSPDGKQMAFLRVVPSQQAHDLIICNNDGTDERVIATRHWPEISWSPTWSPDGRLIAFGARNRDGDSFFNTVMAVPVEGGPEQPLTLRRWVDVGGGEVWLGDGSGVLVTGKERLTDPFQIYFISYPSGEVSRVTNDTNSYSALSITADSRTLVAEMADVTSNIWVAPDGDASRARQVTTGGKDGLGGLSWTPDGKIVYASVSRESFNASAANASRAIWITNSDGSNPRQLTADHDVDTNPVVTPDGRHLVFASHRAGAWGIWRAEMDGGNSTLLASGGTTTFPVCSPDGQWVFFRRLGSAGPPRIWRVRTGGGEPIELTREHAYYPAVSPDGNWVAFFSPSETKISLLVIPSTGGEPVKTFDVAPETDYLIFTEIVRWTADGRYLAYIKNQGDTSNIWGQPFAGGAPRRLTNFDAERIFSFAWSPDGKQLAVARGQYNRQIVLIEDFK